MERPPGVPPRVRPRELDATGGDFVLPSRRAALDRVLNALADPGGLVVLTGEPGVGKSWLCRRLREETPDSWRWAAVDLSPHLGVRGVYRLILRGMGRGLPPSTDPADARLAVEDALAEAWHDGLRWGLILDEAHSAADAVLEELRILGNLAGTPDGFAGFVLVGQSGLLSRLSRPPLSALASRAVERVHLGPFGLAETAEFLRRRRPGEGRDPLDEEMIHRAAAGNPRRLALRIPATPGVAAPQAARPLPAIREAGRHPGLIARPPLRVADGVVEVGWEPPEGGDPDAETATVAGLDWGASLSEALRAQADPEADDPPAAAVTDAEARARQAELAPDRDDAIPPEDRAQPAVEDEPILDHYNALQARVEWARNRAVAQDSTPEAAAADDPSTTPARVPAAPSPDIRVEPEHGFAPYSQLFSRIRQARDNA